MATASLVFYIYFLSAAVSTLLAVRLIWSKLARRYPLFVCYLVFCVLSFALAPRDVSSPAYYWFFHISSAVGLVLYILVVRELVGLILEPHAGIRTIVRWCMYLSIVAATAFSVISMLPKITAAAPKGLFYLSAIDRGVTFSLAVFLVLLLLFLSRYPVALGRNVVTHAVIFTIFFFSSTLTVLLRGVFSIRLYAAFDTALLVSAVLCNVGWLLLLTPKGETVKMTVPHFSPEQEQRILFKLDTLNATLLKAGGK